MIDPKEARKWIHSVVDEMSNSEVIEYADNLRDSMLRIAFSKAMPSCSCDPDNGAWNDECLLHGLGSGL